MQNVERDCLVLGILHSAFFILHLNGGPGGTRTLSLPADNGLLWLFELRIRKWWEVLVMLQSSLPTVVKDAGFTDRQPGHLPSW